jgi:DDE superfamily endonuclease
MWCVAEIDDEYKEKMEDVLAVYENAYNPKEPVVCLDERPLVLHAEVREPTPAKPGKIAKRDGEYKRKGTANAFCVVEPKAGRHITKITKNRKAWQFARLVEEIVCTYPRVRTIHLVMDNLNTHKEKSLTDYFGQSRGKKLWAKITPHYTPKHGSWLNQAEIEISMFSRQCLGKDRIAELGMMKARAHAWNKRMNRDKVKINWTFTRKKAREKFKYRS